MSGSPESAVRDCRIFKKFETVEDRAGVRDVTFVPTCFENSLHVGNYRYTAFFHLPNPFWSFVTDITSQDEAGVQVLRNHPTCSKRQDRTHALPKRWLACVNSDKRCCHFRLVVQTMMKQIWTPERESGKN
jgi:hypothetical protein